VPVTGGPSKPLGFGEGSLASVDAATGRIAFTPWSNENWSWKRYRGGTAPDIWVADAEGRNFTRLTKTRENELFPMWLQGRVWFLSDADGRMNLCSVAPDGSDRKQHTRYGLKDLEPRWAKADPARDGSRIVFTRGADVVLFDAKDGSERTLDLRLVGDRFADRLRSRPPTEGMTGFSLAPDAEALLVESRGEFLVVPLGKDPAHEALPAFQSPNQPATRERGAVWLEDGVIAYITERGDGYALVARDLTDTTSGESVLATSEVWLLDPVASSDGKRVAFADKSGVLRVVEVDGGKVIEVDRSANGTIGDFRFSPDGAWIAWQRPLANGFGQVALRDLETGACASIGAGMTNDTAPRWDPAGMYLYFLSDRHIDPVMDTQELNFANLDTTVACAVPLKASTPPPFPSEAAEADMDLQAWAAGSHGDTKGEAGPGQEPRDGASGSKREHEEGDDADDHDEDDDDHDEAGSGGSRATPKVTIDLDGLSDRVATLALQPGQFVGFEAAPGALLLGRHPRESVGEEVWPPPAMGMAGTHLERFDIVAGKSTPLIEKPVVAWCMDDRATHVATWDGQQLALHGVTPGEATPLEVGELRIDADPRQEWRQIFDDAWKLQRDFFWRADMGGVDWPATRQMYLPLVERVGTRQELNDAIVQMSSELANSHVYISGGEEFRRPEGMSVGVLGADVCARDGGWVIERVLPDFAAMGGPESPLAVPFRGVKPGEFITEIDGRRVAGDRDIGELLVGRAGRTVLLTLAESPDGKKARTLQVKLPEGESELRYLDWVERNRRTVAERSGGRLGYIHVPDMDSAGITAFMRGFYPQIDRDGLVVDIRNNGGGYVSPVLVERLMRKPWSWSVPRDGRAETNPGKTMVGPIVVLVDQGAGSDGDIFPQSMREMRVAPLIGTRTWGGVVGIEGDKPFVDGGMSTQPGWGHWTPSRGYAIENEGVAPDIEVELTPVDRAACRDPQLERAVDELKAKLPAKRFVPPRPESTPPTAPRP